MDVLNHYSLPYKGLSNGHHKIDFEVKNDFFQEFENAHIDNGTFSVEIDLEKKHDHSILDFVIKGTTKSLCDRCMATIDLPIYGEHRIHVQFGNEEGTNEEILYIHPETSTLHLAQLIYEYISISVPMIKTYDCENETERPCNEAVLKKLNTEEQSHKQTSNPIWNTLSDLDLDN
ncbi:MAG: YceD family protein [Saprospiraceae bacterium]